MNYEDIVQALGEIDDALLEAPAKPRHLRRWCALAACLCLTAGLLWLGLRTVPTEPAPVESTPIASETSVTQTFVRFSSPPSEPTEPAEPTLVFAEGEAELAADIAYPDGYFIRELSPDDIAGIWGQTADPALEGTETPLLTGSAIYDGSGEVWVARIHGSLGSIGELTVELSPDQIPLSCIVYSGGATCEFYGTPVTAVLFGNACEISFLKKDETGDIGVRITANGRIGSMEELLNLLVAQSLSGDLRLAQLRVDEVPLWRSEDLTEEAARAEPDLGAYLPKTLPTGYVFETAHREIGEGRDWLSAGWTAGYDNLSLTVYRDGAAQGMTYGLVHADEREKYDLTYYGVSRAGEREDVPEEDWYQWHSPCFYAEELTPEVIERRLSEIDMGQVHTNFGVLYADGTVVRVSVSAKRADLLDLLRFLIK